jgi:hypothetical protein
MDVLRCSLLAAVNLGELWCSAAYRNRIQGAVVVLEAPAGAEPAPVTGQAPNSGTASPG